MRRGEIVQVNLDPARGSEARKVRPAVVVSNDAANATATRLGRGVITDLTRALADDPEFDAWLRRRTPAGRWVRAEDLVGTLVWLAAPASDFVNGQVIAVDGGLTAVI